MTPENKDAIYDVLVQEAGAPEGQRQMFHHSFPECVEYRFMGNLGFGGKVWWSHGRLYVNCYREEMNDERGRIIERTNERLAALLAPADSNSHD